MNDTRLGMGGNQPPSPLTTPEQITAELAENCAALLARRDDLVAAVEAFLAECPEIENEDEQGAATDNLEIIRKTLAEVEDRRVDEKEPFLQGGRAVDAFFKGVKESIEVARDRLYAVANAYASKLRDERKRAAEEAAKIKASQAERLIAEMDHGGSFEAARIAAEQAEAAARLAQAGAHAHTLTVGSYGAKSAQHESWCWEVTDPAAVPRDLCSPDKVKINAAVKAGLRECAGLRIYQDFKLRTRS